MNERDTIATSTDLGQLRLKRGARKRNINKIRSYNESIDGLTLKQIKEDEVRQQLGLLEQQTDIYELIQDRILELLEKLDHENRLEEEESEADEQRHVQQDLREQLGAALCSVQAYSMSQERLQILDETDTLSGAHLEKQIDEARKELKELSLLKEKSGECTEIQDITKELNRTAHQLALRFEKENRVTTTTIQIKLSETHHNIRTLPRMNLPTFEGDPLEWRNFWSLFSSMLEREPTLNEAEKLFYLGLASRVRRVRTY